MPPAKEVCDLHNGFSRHLECISEGIRDVHGDQTRVGARLKGHVEHPIFERSLSGLVDPDLDRASRVFPTPPGPCRVSKATVRSASNRPISRSSGSRPTNELVCTGRLLAGEAPRPASGGALRPGVRQPFPPRGRTPAPPSRTCAALGLLPPTRRLYTLGNSSGSSSGAPATARACSACRVAGAASPLRARCLSQPQVGFPHPGGQVLPCGEDPLFELFAEGEIEATQECPLVERNASSDRPASRRRSTAARRSPGRSESRCRRPRLRRHPTA